LDLLLLATAIYLAVITLVRLMRRRRERIIKDLTEEVELERERLKVERKKEKRRKIRKQMEEQQHRRRGAA
jgi:Flp pilus assembly protein TadB